MKHDTDVTKHFPGILGELARAGFRDQALIMARRWGGQKRYIPITPRATSPIVALIGMEAARALGAMCGGSPSDIPRAHLALDGSLKARILASEGTTRDIAQSLGCTERWVRMVREGPKSPKRPSKKQAILAQSGTPDQIAAKVGASVQYVREVMAQVRRRPGHKVGAGPHRTATKAPA